MNHFAVPLRLRLCALTAATVLGACGGGDGSPPPVPTQTSGYAVDGYLQGSAVLCDEDGNGQPTSGEVTVTSSSSGLFTFPEGCGSAMVVTGGKNADTGLPFTGTLKGAAGSKVVTPLTTLMAAGLSQEQLLAAFGLPADTDVANTDPALVVDGALANPLLMKQTAAVQQLIQKTAEMLGGLQAPADPALQPALYTEVAAAFAEHFQSGAKLNLSATAMDIAEIGNLVKAAALRVGSAAALPPALRSAVKAVNADALGGATAGGLQIQAEAILQSTDAKNLTEVTKAQQSDAQITTYVAANKAALAGSPTAEAVNGMRTALAKQVKDSQGGTPPPPPVEGTLIVSFDEATPAFSDMGAYGGALPSVGPGPAGGSGNALKILKPVAPDTWGGVFFTVAKIPFAADRKVITARVNSTRAGAVIKFKVEVPGGSSVEVASSPTGAANTWSTVSWDFSAVDTTKNYTLIAITPDADLPTSGQTYTVDQITLAPAAPPPPPPPAGGKLLLSFDEATPAFSDMGAYGGALPTVEAGPAGGSGNALKILKPVAPDTWGGTFFMVAPIPFTADRTTLSARVYATRAGAKIKLKVEIVGGSSVEVAGTTTGAANTWSTVKWDLSAVDITKAYKVMAITPDADLPTSGQAYYIDDITLDPAGPPPPPPGATFLTFDEAPPVFTDMGAYGGALPTVEAGPAGGTGNALKILKPVAPDTWGGVFFTTPKIPFTTTNKAISARVRSTKAGAVIKFKVEVPGGAAVEVASAPTGPANTWSTVVWDFSAVDLSKTYKIIAITPDAELATSGQAYYFDDIKVIEKPFVPPPAPVVIATLDEPGAVLTGFEGCWDSTVVADPAGGSNKVGRVVKPGSGVPFYCGTTIVTVANGGFTPIPFTASAKTVSVRVWSPAAGIPVRLKVEDITAPAKSVETEVNTTKVGWQTLNFNFANPVAGTPALDLGTSYTRATIFFKFGSVGTGETYYFDDIVFTGTPGGTPLATFDERNFDNTQSQPSILSGFGGAENSTVVGFADVGVPADGAKTGKLAKVVKNPGEIWAGTSVQRKPNDAVPTIPFVTGATKMSVRVYSAYPGMRVHLKVEQSGRPDFNSEVDAFTSKVNTWETLVFDFGPAGKHFVPSGPGPDGYVTDPASPAYRPTSQLDVSKTFNKVNIFFDYGLGDAGYDAMPGARTYYFDDLKFIGP